MLRTSLLSLALVPLVACGGADQTKDTAADTGTDTADTQDTSDTTDTEDTSEPAAAVGAYVLAIDGAVSNLVQTGDDTDDLDAFTDCGTSLPAAGPTVTLAVNGTGTRNTAGTPDVPDFQGSLTYDTTRDGVVECDSDVAFTGSTYTGDCFGCSFAFEIDASETASAGTDGCELDPFLSYVADDMVGLAWWESYEGYYGTYTNLFASFGTAYSYYYQEEYTDFNVLGYDGGGMGTMTVDGDAVAWQVAMEAVDAVVPTAPATGTVSGTGDVDCSGETYDVWTVDVEAGGEVTFTLDTVALETAFDPVIYIVGPDACYGASADDTFDCTFPPPEYQCPGVTLAPEVAGTYSVIVVNYGTCAAEG
jgi:hypothetical protein